MLAKTIENRKRMILSILPILATGVHLSAGSQLYFAQALRGDRLNTTVVSVQNVDSARAGVTVQFYGSSGQLEETQELTLNPNGGGRVTFGGEGLSLRAGWAAVKSDGRVVATAFYSFQVGGRQVPTIGVLPTGVSKTWRSFINIEPGKSDTGMAVANPDPERSAVCRLSAFHGSDAQLAGTADFELGPQSHMAQFLTQHLPELGSGFEGSALLECDNPTAAVALNQQSDGAASTVAMDDSPGALEVYFAQTLRGDALNTSSIFVQNVAAVPAAATVEFYASSGQLEETRQLALEPNGVAKATLGGEGLSLRAGWATVKSDRRIIATAFYRFQVNGQSVPRIGVLPTGSSTEWRSFVTVDPDKLNTGLAVANPDSQQSAACTLRAYRGEDGQSAGTAEFEVGSRQQTALFLTQIISELAAGFEGSALLECDRPAAAVVLNQRSDGAASTVAMGDTAAFSYACGALLEASANFLDQQLDPITGLPYDQLRCDCRHQSELGVCQSSGVVPQLADADISAFAEDGERLVETVQWGFVDAVPQGAVPTLLHALEVQLQLSEENRFGGLIWGARADVTRYREVRIRYRTSNPSHRFEFKLNTGRPGSVVEKTVELPGTAPDGSWSEVGFAIPDDFPGMDSRFLNYFVLATSRDLAGDAPAIWVDHVAFLADPAASPSCSVTLDCPDSECYPDLAGYEPVTGAVNIANALAAMSLLPETGAVDRERARRRVEAILNSLGELPSVGANPAVNLPQAGWVQDWHSPASLMPDPRNRIASLTDQPQLYSALMVVEQTWPELAEKAALLRQRMDFSVLYESDGSDANACPGSLHWAIDACQGVQSGTLEYYGNDSLLGEFLAIAAAAAPPQFWSQCVAQNGCRRNGPDDKPWYTTGLFCTNSEIPASETGGPFLQLAGLLYLDGDRLRPSSSLPLSHSARNMLTAQADFGLDSGGRLWGWSNASDPEACEYVTCEGFNRAEATPYICAMGLELLPRRCGANLLAFHRSGGDAPLDSGAVVHRYGLRDAWNQETNQGREAFLYLDTGWSVLGLLNACRNGLVRQAFAQHPIAQSGYDLISGEPQACAQPGPAENPEE